MARETIGALTDEEFPMNAARFPARLQIAATLERDRLQHRERRLRLVVRELRARADARRTQSGHVPAPLGGALADFERELRRVSARLGSTGRRA